LDYQNCTSRNCFYLGLVFITWSSKKKNIVVISCTKEYVIVISTGTQALWIIKFLEELGEKQIHPTIIFCDNTSAIKMVKNPFDHSRKKYFDLKCHFILDLVQNKEVELSYIKSQEQIVDIFTKGVAKV
jgi:hypothetical protein